MSLWQSRTTGLGQICCLFTSNFMLFPVCLSSLKFSSMAVLEWSLSSLRDAAALKEAFPVLGRLFYLGGPFLDSCNQVGVDSGPACQPWEMPLVSRGHCTRSHSLSICRRHSLAPHPPQCRHSHARALP